MSDPDLQLADKDADMAEADGGGSSGSDSSDDSDFEEIDISAEDTALIMKLEQQLRENPAVYDTHVQLIEALRRCKMGSRLREARQAMQATFPLTEALWFDWLSDEIERVKDASDIPGVEALMEAAVADYLSVPLWVHYLEFLRDFDPEVTSGSAEGRAKMRDACERALTAGGLHVTDGSKLWAVCRRYELALLEQAPSDEQADHVRRLWTRQLQVPLADGAETLKAYLAWERGTTGKEDWQLPAALQQSFAKAQQAVELRRPYEESVAAHRPADADLLAAYMAYARVEERGGDPARVQVVYERAVAAFPVTHYLWVQYARYLETHLKINSVTNKVYERAVRNCPWVGQLWGRALRALERSGASEEQHAAMYERALAAGLQTYEDHLEVFLARLDCLRRRGADAAPALRATFQQADERLRACLPDQLDRSFRLTAYWADCEADVCNDLAAARAVWEAALKGVAGRYADTWATFIDFERRRGHIREARTLYKRCYSRRLEEGGQALMCDAWLRFEREHGSAEDYLAACLKVEPLLQELQAAATAAADPAQHAVARAAADKAPNLSKEEVRAMRQQADPNYGKRKPPGEVEPKQAGAAAPGQMPPPPAKKRKTAPTSEPAPSVTAAVGTADTPDSKSGPSEQREPEAQHNKAEPAHLAHSPEGGSEAAEHQHAGRPGGLGWRQQRRTESNTAFVKHLADGMDEAAVRRLFGGCGPIVGVELGRDKATGRFKGFAYVHFASQEGLQAACQLDRTQYNGKHIFVAPSKPPATDQQPKQQQQEQQQQAKQQQQQQQGGRGRGSGRDGGRGSGRDGGRGGGRDGGRGGGRDGGRGGGRDGGRGGDRDGGRGRHPGRGAVGGPKHRSLIDLGPHDAAGQQPAPPVTGFVPRSAALQGKEGSHGTSDAPKSNDEFRKLFLSKK